VNVNEYTLDKQLDVVHGYIVKRFGTHQMIEDLLQEAKVVAWKKYMDGKTSKEICVAARFHCLDLISGRRKDRWLGSPPRESKDYAEVKGEATREKIRQYIHGYCTLHGHNPSSPEIAKAVGLSAATVKHHMGRLYRFTGPTEFYTESLDIGFQDDSGETHSIVDHIKFGYTFENELVDKMDTRTLMNETLDAREKAWVYHKMFEGLSQPQIAQLYGYSANMVSLVVRGAMKKMRERREEQSTT
jgi:DNA-directed RNA polymerase specialized sigma24 family protein